MNRKWFKCLLFLNMLNMAALFSFHLLFMVLKIIVKISVERNKRFHSLWVIGIIINVMVPTQPL